MLASLMTVKTTAAAALSAGILLTGSIGAATAGVLPAGAQDSASDLLSRVGLHVPNAKERAGERADERAESHEQGPASTRPEDGANAHGKEVSGVARMDGISGATDGTGKGKAVSEVASSKNQADEHRRDRSASGDRAGHSGAPEHQPSRPAGSHGDPARAKADENQADAATKAGAGKAKGDAAATDGATNATESSGGHSTGGSAQRP